MKIAILGAGVIGVTTAHYLARQGHEVTVIDRQSGPALETSFANAGEISPGYSSPWAAPGIPAKAVKWLFMRHAPLILHPQINAPTVAWLLSLLRNCTSARYALNKARMVRLADYSQVVQTALNEELGLQYDHRTQGTLQLFRTQKQLDGIYKDTEVLREGGVPFEVLDQDGCIAAEPGLKATRDLFVGGLRLPRDETGDCFKFTVALADHAAATQGVTFQYGTTIQGLIAEGGRVTGVKTDKGLVTADAYVLALGSYSPMLVKPLGMTLPVYPVKGYSITAPIINEPAAPVSTIMDESYKVAITRLGDRIRVGGMAEIAGFSDALPERRRNTLEHSVGSLFPGAGDLKAASYWSGLRPMTPDGTPVIGKTKIDNLFLNTGHGTLGWTMACGSARVIADLISGQTPDIETADLGIARYGR
ncbi:D-amino acid dehydrogenase small subunit [Brevundimonas naejangsanensis]|uniref:D-amino acid dehydrogenase n=2 Tax=Brevundimonas naejangsanensis TaxID=588932 RepID=A0A172Y2I6_9CAUL|nr:MULTISPECIES: D-amino acid dehydrogenase [Brevundimonas]ANF53419.1 D-amino acid dehydrogenase small subunit [Brevundimonas naejangsanensis]